MLTVTNPPGKANLTNEIPSTWLFLGHSLRCPYINDWLCLSLTVCSDEGNSLSGHSCSCQSFQSHLSHSCKKAPQFDRVRLPFGVGRWIGHYG